MKMREECQRPAYLTALSRLRLVWRTCLPVAPLQGLDAFFLLPQLHVRGVQLHAQRGGGPRAGRTVGVRARASGTTASTTGAAVAGTELDGGTLRSVPILIVEVVRERIDCPRAPCAGTGRGRS